MMVGSFCRLDRAQPLQTNSGLAGLLPGMKMQEDDQQLIEVIFGWALPGAIVVAAALNSAWQNPLSPVLFPAFMRYKLK